MTGKIACYRETPTIYAGLFFIADKIAITDVLGPQVPPTTVLASVFATMWTLLPSDATLVSTFAVLSSYALPAQN